jgi:hypothetical protein
MESALTRDDLASVRDAQNWLALRSGALSMFSSASRGSAGGSCIAVASTRLLYCGATGQWPGWLPGCPTNDEMRTALGGDHGVRVHESLRLELPIEEVYGFNARNVAKSISRSSSRTGSASTMRRTCITPSVKSTTAASES